MSQIEPLSRLHKELARLYGWGTQIAANHTRVCVLEVQQPENWSSLSRVWQGVQADHELPAPGIVVSGAHGFQLWFSLQSAITTQQASHFLEGLRSQYLADVAERLVVIHLDPFGHAGAQPHGTPPVPAKMENCDQWSAFLAPDLAPVFNETPWLDFPPNPDGQADLLARLKSMSFEDFESALTRMLSAPASALKQPASEADRSSLPELPLTQPASTHEPAEFTETDPKRFLLRVMNDPTVAMQLRIEAAKALLP